MNLWMNELHWLVFLFVCLFLFCFVFFFFGSFFSELGTEPRALRFLGKHSTTELNPQHHTLVVFDLGLFSVRFLGSAGG